MPIVIGVPRPIVMTFHQFLRDTGYDAVEMPDDRPVERPDPWRTELENAILAEAFERVRASVSKTCFDSFMQFAWNGRPAVDVARDLGISENSVYVNKHRVLERLRTTVAAIREDIGFD